MTTARLTALANKAREIDTEYERCCKELGLNPRLIHDNISSAPNYPAYYRKAVEYSAIAKAAK